MNIIYASCTCSKKKFAELFKDSKQMPGQQVQKYHRLIMEGMVLNGTKVKTVTAQPITSLNFRKKIMKKDSDEENGVLYGYLPMLNIPIIKNILIVACSFFTTLKYLKEDKQAVVICDVLNVSVSTGALFATKLLKRKSLGIVTDIPIFLAENSNSLSVRFNNYIINHFNSYVFLTQQMKELVNKRQVPYVVIEGQADIRMQNVENMVINKYEKKVCIYAGGLQKIYGIKFFTRAFLKANISESELHIFGSGDFEEELVEICRTHNNIKYFGSVPNNEVVEAELKATLLINPRPSSEEFIKFSFPSKNMEYMVSGTPVLTTKLPGMPDEYCEYVYIFDEESIKGMTEKLRYVMSIPIQELHNKGLFAKQFVLKKKNNIVQTKKIIDVINEIRRN